MKRRSVYIFLTILCFGICILIVNSLSNYQFIRGFMGDVLVNILIYCFIKIFIDINPFKLCIFILLFSYAIEFLQYLRFIDYIGLEQSRIARIIFGATFDFRDLIAYTIGITIIYFLDAKLFYRMIRNYS